MTNYFLGLGDEKARTSVEAQIVRRPQCGHFTESMSGRRSRFTNGISFWQCEQVMAAFGAFIIRTYPAVSANQVYKCTSADCSAPRGSGLPRKPGYKQNPPQRPVKAATSATIVENWAFQNGHGLQSLPLSIIP
jgi:hypothetical protein